MRLIILAPVVSGLCPLPSSSSGGETKVVCLHKEMADLWLKMANEGNDPETKEFLRYRSAVLKATKRPAEACSYDLESDAYFGPESKLSGVALALLNGERPKERPDFRSWKQHALMVKSCQHVCKDNEVAIALVKRTETFYSKRNLKQRSLQECDVFLAGYLNFYAPHKCVHQSDPDMFVGIEDKTGVCMRVGTEVDKNGSAVRRDGDWYPAPMCIAVRQPGNELNPHLQECDCCGDFEFNIQQSGVVLYAQAPQPPKMSDSIEIASPEEMIFNKACCFINENKANVERSTDNQQMSKVCEAAHFFTENKEECLLDGFVVEKAQIEKAFNDAALGEDEKAKKVTQEAKEKMVCGKFCETRKLKVSKGVNLLANKDVCKTDLDTNMCMRNKTPMSNIPGELNRVNTLVNGRAISAPQKTVICFSSLMNK